MKLFDDFERHDPAPGRYLEDSYSFLNRVDQPFWARVRCELERWFAEVPEQEALDLARRFQSADPAQHHAAWWELYLFRLFTCLGWTVEHHPQLPDTDSRPDFLVKRGERVFLMEAFTTFSGISSQTRSVDSENWIKATVDQVRSDDFFVQLSFERKGTRRPRSRDITLPLMAWLGGLDADAVLAAGAEGMPELVVDAADWRLLFRAFAVRADRRGDADRRLLGVGPIESGYVDDAGALQCALERKRRKYGTPDVPLLFAVLMVSGFVDKEDVESALFGSTGYRFSPGGPEQGEWVRKADGFWAGPRGPAGTRVSAAVVGSDLYSHTIARDWPRVWVNPWATKPLDFDATLPFPRMTVSVDGRLEQAEAARHPSEVFGLPEDWPGPESPFVRAGRGAGTT